MTPSRKAERKLVLFTVFLLAIKYLLSIQGEGVSYHEKPLYERTQKESKCSKGRLPREQAAIDFDENKLHSMSTPHILKSYQQEIRDSKIKWLTC